MLKLCRMLLYSFNPEIPPSFYWCFVAYSTPHFFRRDLYEALFLLDRWNGFFMQATNLFTSGKEACIVLPPIVTACATHVI